VKRHFLTITLLLCSGLLSAKEINGLGRPPSEPSSCTLIDYRDELPPVRNQGNMGWCYAFAAADLVSHKLQQNISPLHIALNYNHALNQGVIQQASRDSIQFLMRTLGLDSQERKNPPSPTTIRNQFVSNFIPESHRETGWVDRSIVATQNSGGFCLDQPIEGLSQDNEQFIAVMGMINHMRESYLRELSNSPSMSGEEYICEHFKIPETLVLPLDTIGIENLSNYLEGQLLRDLFFHLIDEHCQQRIQANLIPHQINLRHLNQADKLQSINQILEGGSILSINFMSQMLTGPQTEGEYHSATIVGRRRNNETLQCEYLVRNSWGPDCERYSTNECEDGHIWISQSDILDYAQELNHL
jgi:hypothetical protein